MNRDVYKHSFLLLKDETKGISIAAATEILKLLLEDRLPHTDLFIAFLNSQNSIQTINLDQWMLFLDFSLSVGADFSSYDPNEAWPVLLDDFVQWSKQQTELRLSSQRRQRVKNRGRASIDQD